LGARGGAGAGAGGGGTTAGTRAVPTGGIVSRGGGTGAPVITGHGPPRNTQLKN